MSASAPARRSPSPPPAPATEIRSFLEAKIESIARACPEKVRPEQLIQVVATAIYKSEYLQKCDKASILAAVIQGSELGLSFSPSLGEAYLIPRWNSKAGGYECCFQPGYQGLIQLAYRSRLVAMVDARLVREGDEFALEYDPGLVFRHRPVPWGAGGPVVGVYAYARLVNGEAKVEPLSLEDIERSHERSEAYKTAQKKGWVESGPWVSDWEEMARKTAIRRIFKHIPRSKEIAVALEAHDRDYLLDDDGPRRTLPDRRGVSGLKARFQALEAPSDDEGPSYGVEEGVPRPLRTEPDDEPEPDHDALHREAFDEANPMPPVDPEDAEIDRMAARETGLFPAGGGESVDPEEGGKGARRGGRR